MSSPGEAVAATLAAGSSGEHHFSTTLVSDRSRACGGPAVEPVRLGETKVARPSESCIDHLLGGAGSGNPTRSSAGRRSPDSAGWPIPRGAGRRPLARNDCMAGTRRTGEPRAASFLEGPSQATDGTAARADLRIRAVRGQGTDRHTVPSVRRMAQASLAWIARSWCSQFLRSLGCPGAWSSLRRRSISMMGDTRDRSVRFTADPTIRVRPLGRILQHGHVLVGSRIDRRHRGAAAAARRARRTRGVICGFAGSGKVLRG